jgi:aspartate-semialdehyde dehydrogenase
MRLAIVGATGLVGQTFLNVLNEYQISPSHLVLLASKKSAGKRILFQNKSYEVQALNEHSFDEGFDVVLFSAGSEASKIYAPIAASKGAIVIDNSSAWRMDADVPLVVPEVNLHHVGQHKIIANPNCSTIQSVLPLNALKPLGLKRVVYTTYQAVSGSGQKGIDDLERNLKGETSVFYPKPILHNVIPHIDVFLDSGDTKEEQKMREETRKILDLVDLPISATCVRVPVRNGHSVAINVELSHEFSLETVFDLLQRQAGIHVWTSDYPTPMDVQDQDVVHVGRIRRDVSVPYGLNLWVVADNVRKGAAANAVQIALAILKEKNHV